MLLHKLSDRLGEYVDTTKEIAYCCPFCSDMRYRFYINKKKLLYFCQNCEVSGHVKYLFKKLNLDYMHTPDEWTECINAWIYNVPDKTESSDLDHITLPEDAVPVSSGSEADGYLYSRGYDRKTILDYKMHCTYDRIIVPTYDRAGTLLYYVGRAFRPGVEPKYKNPQSKNRSKCIFNAHRISQGDEVIITEGVFSAISAGFRGVATFGKYVSRAQKALLLNLKASTYYVCLDDDAYKQAADLCQFLHNNKVPTYYVPMPPGVDPNDMGYDKFKDYYLTNSWFYTPHVRMHIELDHVNEKKPNPFRAWA